MTLYRNTLAEVNLEAFRHNLRIVKHLAGPNATTMAIVKADAYGHGAVPCVRAAIKEGVNHFGVGIIQEGIELRENGVSSPILVLGGINPDEIEDLIKFNLSTSLSTLSLAKAISKQAEYACKKVNVHIKINTGMGRLGFNPEDFSCQLNGIMDDKNLNVEGIFTHLACADEEDSEVTHNQISCFSRLLEEWKNSNKSKPNNIDRPLLVHIANTAGLVRFPESRFNMVRPGISLYGSMPSKFLSRNFNQLIKEKNISELLPVMQWKTKIVQVQSLIKGTPLSYGGRYVTKKDSLIATLPVGYADGLNRRLSNNMEFLVKGKRAKQVGTICMDMCLIDITNIVDVALGEDVVILGNQGKSQILVEEMATQAETIPYEILCCISKRVPRVYVS